MKKKLALFLGLVPFLAAAQNPIIQTKYTADPAPWYIMTHYSFM